MLNKKTLIASETPKGWEILRNCAVRLDKVGLLDEDALQNVVHRAGELQTGIAELVKNLSVSISNQFADEEVPSNYGYLSGYKKPIAISDQIDILRGYWPNLNPDAALKYYREMYGGLQFPEWVEGPFALIRPGFFSNQYGEELEEVLKALEKARDGRFMNHCKGKLGSEYLIQTEQSLVAMAHIIAQQPNSDIIIVSEQFGIRHRGKSVRKAGVVIESSPSEFGEGAKNVGTMILTHPNRLAHSDDLWMDCPGDRYRPDARDDFCTAPHFYFHHDKANFASLRVVHLFFLFYERYGSVSGVLPECLTS